MECQVCRSVDVDEDDDDYHHFTKELDEEKNRLLMKNESSQIKTNSKLQRCKRKRITSHSVGEVDRKSKLGSPAMVQARRVQLSLGTQSPSFVKLLRKSHGEGNKSPQVSLPYSFCRLYLPKDEHISITLEDEKGEDFEIGFISKWMRFAAGWKKFVDYHGLRERDVLIFHLVEPTKFKVYIIRADDHINPKSSLVEQNGQGVLESSGLSNPSQELGTFKDFESKRAKLLSARKIELERKQSSPAMLVANRMQLTKSPSFTRLIFKYVNVLRIPVLFCTVYLPKDETMMTLEDENEDVFEVMYMPNWKSFRAGWSKFVNAHNLHEDDVLLFHLVDPKKFKVYIIRADEQINANSSLVERNGQGVLESSDLSNPSQELGTFEDFNSKHVELLSAGKTKLESKQRSPAMLAANRIKLTKYPSFTRSIFKYVRELRLSASFCTLHLPKDETMMTLENENGNQFEVKYIPKWKGLSAGWLKFIHAHNLHEGDVLLFHLVDPKKFKVYITRIEDYQVNVNPSLKQQTEQGGSESSDDPTDQSIDLGTFAEFEIKVRSLCLESELDDNTLKKYYKLCCSKNDILHNKILNLNSKLITSIISKTVKIADAVKSCDFFTPKEKLEQWENSLKSFKLLGMKVDFLVDRVSQLLMI